MAGKNNSSVSSVLPFFFLRRVDGIRNEISAHFILTQIPGPMLSVENA
jgi:hypothetical protein